jgi:hypothetical protein
MTAPKNPVGSAAPEVPTFVAVRMSSSELTPAETRWLTAYRLMDHRRKGENLAFMEDTARTYPAGGKLALAATKNGIRLVASFGKAVTG